MQGVATRLLAESNVWSPDPVPRTEPSMHRTALAILIPAAFLGAASQARAQGYAPSFQRVDLLSGQSPLAVALGDLDGDGDSDLIVGRSGSIDVLLADGGGGFAAATSFSQGGLNMEDIAVGDIDGDGALDVAGIDRPQEKVGVLLGDGAGALGAALLKPVGLALEPTEIGVAVADIDVDTRADVLVTGAAQDALLYFGSTGAGALANPIAVPSGDRPFDVAIGDVNGDGLPDAVLAVSVGVRVLLGAGVGGLLPQTPTLVTGGIFKLGVGDFDSDGFDDVCATRRSLASVAVLRSQGTGTLAAPTFITLPGLGQELCVLDVSRDGAPDIAVEVFSPAAVHSFVGDGAGGFTASTVTSLPAFPYRIASGDIDADVASELAISYQVVGAGISVLRNHTLASTAGFAYCTSKPNSLGCLPTMSASGASSASASSGFTLSALQVRNQRAGILIYGLHGPATIQYFGATLCVRTPLRRTPVQNSGGSPASTADCSGAFAIDMNAFASGLAGGAPAPELTIVNTEVVCQYWSRDPGASFNASLSNGWLYSVGL